MQNLKYFFLDDNGRKALKIVKGKQIKEGHVTVTRKGLS